MEHDSSTTSAVQHQAANLRGVASAYIEAYMTPGGASSKPMKRWRVRARVPIARLEDGRIVTRPRLLHVGSRSKKGDATLLLDWAEEEMRYGRIPYAERYWQQAVIAAPTMTVTQAIDQYLRQRRNFADRTRATYTSLRPHIDRALGSRDVFAVTPNDVRELIDACVAAPLGPDATRSVRGILAGALRHAGVKPNPAHDETVTLPSRTVTRMDVPPAEHIRAIYQRMPSGLLLPMMLLEATGARISELLGVELGDVDHASGRLRLVGKGDKPRLVPLPAELGALMPRVSASQRATAGLAWPGLTPDRVRKAMTKACDDAKITRYAPHSMRRRFASRHVQIGTSPPQLSAWLGHARTSMTLDVYAKVLADGDTIEVWREFVHE